MVQAWYGSAVAQISFGPISTKPFFWASLIIFLHLAFGIVCTASYGKKKVKRKNKTYHPLFLLPFEVFQALAIFLLLIYFYSFLTSLYILIFCFLWRWLKGILIKTYWMKIQVGIGLLDSFDKLYGSKITFKLELCRGVMC